MLSYCGVMIGAYKDLALIQAREYSGMDGGTHGSVRVAMGAAQRQSRSVFLQHPK